LKHDQITARGLTFVGAGRFRDDVSFGRWDQCVEYPRLHRIVTRRRSDRQTTIEWTVDGRRLPGLPEALAAVGAGQARKAEG
jgi:hypothetical protein